mgnify:CR=1 FL=1
MILRGGICQSVDTPVSISLNEGRRPFDTLGIGQKRFRGTCARVEGDDLGRRIAEGEVDPALVVGGDEALVLRPVLLVHVAEVCEFPRRWVEPNQTAVRVADGPDAAVVVLGHTHGHFWFGFVAEREGAGVGIKLNKVTVEVGVVTIATRQNRSVGTVVTRIERDGHFVGLARDGIDNEAGIPAAVIKEPDQDNITTFAVPGCNRTSVIADRCRHTMISVWRCYLQPVLPICR